MANENYVKVKYPWALSLDKLNAAQDQLIADGVELTEEVIKARYITLQGRLEVEIPASEIPVAPAVSAEGTEVSPQA